VDDAESRTATSSLAACSVRSDPTNDEVVDDDGRDLGSVGVGTYAAHRSFVQRQHRYGLELGSSPHESDGTNLFGHIVEANQTTA